MKKILALFCSVAVFFAFTAFDWKDSSDTKAEEKKPAAPPPTAPNADAITALNNLLGAGTPAQRQAKLDTLVSLSQILPVVAPQGVAATTPAQAAVAASSTKQSVQKTKSSTQASSRRW